MAPTRTIKNKHAGSKSSSSSSSGPKRSSKDGIKKPSGGGGGSKGGAPKGKIPSKEQKGKPNFGQDKNKKKKARVYTEKELGIPELNMITPVGVTKPKGKKKGKVFVDDRESMSTILAIVQAEKEGQIESKLIKARQMEEIREARKAEAEKKEQERKAKLDETKELMRKKRKRSDEKNKKEDEEDDKIVKDAVMGGTKAAKAKGGNKKKTVSFAAE